MTDYGVIPEGFLKKTLAIILGEIEDAERSLINPRMNLLATSLMGQINGIYADKLRELWDVLEAVYRSAYPDSASGEALDQVASITGAIRIAAAKSTVLLDCLQLGAHCTVPAGSLVSVGTDGEQFATMLAVSNSEGYPVTASVEAESVNYGEIQGLAGTIDSIQSPVSGWSSAPALTCVNIETYALVNGYTLIIKIDEGTPQTITFLTGDFLDITHATAAEVAAKISSGLSGGTALDAGGYVRVGTNTEETGGSVQVTGGTANAILGFATDLIKGFNSLDATLGRQEETDAEFRIRRNELLRITGAGTLESIRARVRELDGVIQAFIFENITMIVDAGGLPPKSFEVVVSGGDEDEIAAVIFATKPIGIESYGLITKSVVDSMGFAHDIKFSRPTEKPIYIDVTVLTDPLVFPVDGADQVKTALVALGDSLQIGDDIIALAFRAAPLDVAGVIDVPTLKIDIVNPPTNTANLIMLFRELALFDTSRINVTVTT